MSTKLFFNPSPATQGQLLEALASGQFSINHLAESFSTTAEALSLFITTDSFATRFAAIGSTNASLIRFSASLNLFSALKLLNTLALKLDEQLRTIPVDYTNPLSIEQFRRRAECARQVASALYRLSRFTHEPPRARAATSDSYTIPNQARPSAPAAHESSNHAQASQRTDWHDQPHAQPANQTPEAAINQTLPTPAPTSTETRGSDTPERSDPATHSPLPVLHQTRASDSTERSHPAAHLPPTIPTSTSPEPRASESSERSEPGTNVPSAFPASTPNPTRASESAERSDPGTHVPVPRDQQRTPTPNDEVVADAAHAPAPSNTPPAAQPASSLPAAPAEENPESPHSRQEIARAA